MSGSGKFLIDVTDPRFFIPANEEVLAFVRRANPFCHSDVGSVLLELGDGIEGSHEYCPSFKSCAYVVLHDDESRIFAIAYGQRALAFRLGPESRAAALAEGGVAAPQIGGGWVLVDPWQLEAPSAERRPRLERWCAQAFAERRR